jgi:hypothetical protein
VTAVKIQHNNLYLWHTSSTNSESLDHDLLSLNAKLFDAHGPAGLRHVTGILENPLLIDRNGSTAAEFKVGPLVLTVEKLCIR